MPDRTTLLFARDRCIGAGMCALVAPELFSQGADGVAQPQASELSGGSVTAAQEAAEVCPSGAILLRRTLSP